MKKLYFGEKLVYQNLLKSGTILFDGDQSVYDGDKLKVVLSGVSSDLSNTPNGLKISYESSNTGYAKHFSTAQLLQGVALRAGSAGNAFYVKMIANSNQLGFTAQRANTKLTRIEVS